jgi:Mu-like prophage I protein
MHFTSAEIRLIALHARLARPLHETVRALAEALPEVAPGRILELARLALDPDDASGADGADDDDDAADDDYGDDDATVDDGAPPPDESAEAMAARHADELARCADDDERADCEARQAAERAAFTRGPASAARAAMRRARSLTATAFRARMARDPMVLGLNRAIGELRGQRAAEKAVVRVDAAIAAGKLVPAQREWAIAYCAADAAGFNRFVGAQPAFALAAEGMPGSPASPARHASAAATLSEDEARICTQTRTDPQKFLARRAQAQAAMAAQPAAGSIIRLELN